jgi:hypothetical protein
MRGGSFLEHLRQANALHLTKKIHHLLWIVADASCCVKGRAPSRRVDLTSSGEIAASHVFGCSRAVNWRYASNTLESMFHLALQRGRKPHH